MKFPFPSLPLHTSHVHHTPKPSNQKPTSVFFSFRNDKQKNPKKLINNTITTGISQKPDSVFARQDKQVTRVLKKLARTKYFSRKLTCKIKPHKPTSSDFPSQEKRKRVSSQTSVFLFLLLCHNPKQ